MSPQLDYREHSRVAAIAEQAADPASFVIVIHVKYPRFDVLHRLAGVYRNFVTNRATTVLLSDHLLVAFE